MHYFSVSARNSSGRQDMPFGLNDVLDDGLCLTGQQYILSHLVHTKQA